LENCFKNTQNFTQLAFKNLLINVLILKISGKGYFLYFSTITGIILSLARDPDPHQN